MATYHFKSAAEIVEHFEREAAMKRRNSDANYENPSRGRTTKRTRAELEFDRGEAHAYEMVAHMLRDCEVGSDARKPGVPFVNLWTGPGA